MEYTLLEEPEQYVIGIQMRTSNADPDSFRVHWERFFKEGWLKKIPRKTTSEIMALYTDYEGDHTKPFNFIIGATVENLDKIPEGMVGKVLPASTYATFIAKGRHPETLIDAWQTIWESDLERTFIGDYELYSPFFPLQPSPEIDIYIGIKS